MNVHHRIREGRAKLGLTQQQFADKVGVTRGAVQQWEKEDGEGGTAPSRAKQPAVAQLLGISVAELMGGAPENAANVERYQSAWNFVPLISWDRVAVWCASSAPPSPEDSDQWMACHAAHSARTFALRVRGDSMVAPTGLGKSYPEGSLIFVDPAMRKPTNGQRVVARLRGSNDVLFKIYKNEDGRTWLQPLNPMHRNIEGEIVVLGTVIGKWEDEA